MQHNDFEKYLRDQADKFWLEPDPGSFGRVLDALQREKKRRRFLFILFFSLFGLGVCGGLLWWLWGNHSSATEIVQADTIVVSGQETIYENKQQNAIKQTEEKTGATNASSEIRVKNQTENKIVSEDTTENRIKENKKTELSSTGGITTSKTGKKKPENTTSQPPVVLDEKTVQSSHSDDKNKLALTAELEKNAELTTQSEEQSGEVNSSSIQTESLTETTTNNIQASETPAVVTDTPKVKTQSRFLDPNRTNKWVVSAWFSGFAAGSRFEHNPDTAGNLNILSAQNYANYRNYYNILRFGFSAGGSVGYTPIQYLTIELGLQYTEFTSLEKPVGYPNQPIDSLAPADPYPINVSTVNEGQVIATNFKMLQIPLLFTFNWNWGKSAIHVSAGATFSYTTAFKGYEVSSIFNQLTYNTKADSSSVERFGIGLLSKLLYSYQILPNFSLYAGPTFQYRFNSLFNNAYIIRQYPYFIGLETGLRVHF